MLGDALSYLPNSDDRIPIVLIGGIILLLQLGISVVSYFSPLLWLLTLLPSLLFSAILLGYGVRVLNSAARGEDAAPSFVNWMELIVDGLKITIANLGYLVIVLVPLLVFILTLVISVNVNAQSPSAVANAVTGVIGIVGTLCWLLFVLVIGYLVPAAYANYAIEGELSAAFDVSTIYTGAKSSEYFSAWILSLVVAVIGGIAGLLLSAVLIGVFVLFYVQVVTHYLWGQGFARGLANKRRAAAETNF